MIGGIEIDATWAHLWQRDCHGTAPLYFPSQERVVVQKGPAPGTAAQQRCCSMVVVGKHRARGKHQTGEQNLTQRGEEINSMLFFSHSAFFLSSRPFLNSCF